MLKTSQLCKTYQTFTACSNINISIGQEQVVGLFGPNGAGKSTCFHMITGLIRPTSGTLSLDDEDITSAPIHARAQKGIGFLPQDSSIFRSMTVAENIMSVLELHPTRTKSQRLDRLAELIDRFELHKVEQSEGQYLSGGERRRTEIARALANNPKYILLDEPFAGIDPKSIHEIKKLITHIREVDHVGVLITDHNVQETISICDEAYVLHKGNILAQGRPQDILQNPAVIEHYLGDESVD